MHHAVLPHIPLWLLSALFLFGLLAAREVGRWIRSSRSTSQVGDGGDAFAMTSALGLLALLIGFTFSIALSRYDARRELVVKEANAIGTTWLRLQLLGSDDRARLESLLRSYVDTRIAFGNARDPDEEAKHFRLTEARQAEIWAALMSAIAPFRDSPRASLLVTTTNDSIDLAAERFATRQAHIPLRIVRMMVVVALLAAGLVGYERGHQRTTTTLLFVLLALAATLVADLDRPSTGRINVPQEPMLDLRLSMGSSAPLPGK